MWRRRAATVAAVAALAALPACGGGSDDADRGDETSTRAGALPGAGAAPAPVPPLAPATTPARFAANFAHVTGVRLTPVREPSGTRFDVPRTPDRWPRLGVYDIRWTTDARQRDALLGSGPPDSSGRWWERSGGGPWSVARPFGDALVATSPQGATQVPDAKWLRLERAVEAARSGDVAALPDEEQPCRDRGLTPLLGATGSCSVAGIPITFVDATETLTTPLLEARVRGVDTADEVEDRYGLLDRERASGRFVVIAYTVRNPGRMPIPYLEPRLHLVGRTFEEDPDARALMPRSRSLPLEPGATFETRAVFDVPRDLAARAAIGALVLPVGENERGEPDAQVGQGWIRLAAAAPSLPDPPPPAPQAPPGGTTPSPPPTGRPYRPPAIPFDRGSGRDIGAVVRARYVASAFFPLPSGFVPGGIPIGSRAGICSVPAISARDRAELQAAARRQTPLGSIEPIDDQDILLADCGAAGRWAFVTWTQVRGGRTTDWIDELRDDPGGRWTGTARGVHPGCRMPRDAAAAWQVDVTPCGPAPRARAPARPRARPRPAPPPAPRPPAPRPRQTPPRRPAPLPEGSQRA